MNFSMMGQPEVSGCHWSKFTSVGWVCNKAMKEWEAIVVTGSSTPIPTTFSVSMETVQDRGALSPVPCQTAYLLWSTRKRRDVVVDHPDWTFAQIAKWISAEWKKIDADEKDELQKEAEEMNELEIRKLPRDDDGVDPERDTTDDDSDFEEGYRKKKPIIYNI